MSERGDDTALSYRLEGASEGETVVFVHGWPDGPDLWRHQVAALRDRFRCVVVTLPNFGPEPDRRGGYDFPELVERLSRTVGEVQQGDRPVHLVTHDWGAYLGYLFEQAHPERVARMVALDIGGHVRPGTVREGLMMVAYQWTLIACWLAGGLSPAVGDRLCRGVARVLGVPAPQARKARSRFNYPYYYFWRGMLLPWARGSLLSRYRPRCPVLFLYGARKPLMFHSEHWLRRVEDSGGRHACIEQGGHWFMETHPDEVNALIEAWLAGGASPPRD